MIVRTTQYSLPEHLHAGSHHPAVLRYSWLLPSHQGIPSRLQTLANANDMSDIEAILSDMRILESSQNWTLLIIREGQVCVHLAFNASNPLPHLNCLPYTIRHPITHPRHRTRFKAAAIRLLEHNLHKDT